MGHSSSHQPSLNFRIAAVGASACMGLMVPAPPASAADTSAPEAFSRAPAAAEPVGVNDCHSTDNGDPRLVEFRYGPAKVNVVNDSDQVRFRVQARDTGGPGPASGVRTVLVWFGTSGGGDEFGTDGHRLRKRGDGWWVGSVPVPLRTPHRLWPVEGLELRDRAGNGESYSRADLRRLTGRSLDVFITTARDRTRARLTAFSVTPKSVDTRDKVRYVTFKARMVDRQSDVHWVVVDGSGDTSWLSPETGSVELTKVPGSRHRFRARVPVPRWVGDRAWRTTGVWTWNSANKLASYSSRELAELGFDSDFSVASGTDRTRPQARSLDVSEKALDVRTRDAEVSFTVHATDLASGVHSVIATSEEEDFWLVLTRTSGTANDGVWTGTLDVDHCRTTTGTWRLNLLVFDRNGDYSQSTEYDAEELAARGWQHRIRVTGGDHERPWVDLSRRVRPTGPIRMTTSEAVQGIGPDSARLHRIRADGSLGRALPGTWRCLDRRKDRVSCRTGSVREALFEPSHRMIGGARYAVALNPEHHLAIIDLAGNPLRQTPRRLSVNQ
jgi:hypothetical protein